MTHGRLDAEHVLLTPDGRPLLTGFAVVAESHSPRADVAALAALLGHLLTGRAGITAEHLAYDRELAAVPGLSRLLDDGLSVSSAAEFAYRLRDAAARLLPPAPTTSADAYPALTASSGTHPALTAPSGTYPALTARSGTYPALTAPSGTFPALTAPSSTSPALRTPTGAYPVRPDATSARLTVPAAARSSPGVGRSRYDGAWTDRFAGEIADVRAYQEAVPAGTIAAIAAETRPA